MEEFVKEFNYSARNVTEEWDDRNNQNRLGRLIQNLKPDEKNTDLLKAAKIVFIYCNDDLNKHRNDKDENKTERERSHYKIFKQIMNYIVFQKLNAQPNIDLYMDLFRTVSKQKEHVLFKLLCTLSLLKVINLNFSKLLDNLNEEFISEVFLALEIDLNPDENYYFKDIIDPWKSEIDKLLAQIQNNEEFFVKNILAIQRYFE